MDDHPRHYRLRDGWLQPARRVPSPNFGPRPDGASVELLVVHNISLPPGNYGGDAIERFFCNRLDCDVHPYFEQLRDMAVSAHLLLRRDGEALQFVNFEQRAWHAGRSRFRGREECNDFSIGIELEGADDDPYTGAQYQALAGIAATLVGAYPALGPDRLVGHCDIAPGRKSDPGPAFDWGTLHRLLERVA